MKNIIDVGPIEIREWLKSHSHWCFNGKVNKISYERIFDFVKKLYNAGCESIRITDYEWEIEPVYEGDEFHPNMLVIKLPVKSKNRQTIFYIVNNNFSELKAKSTYKDSGLENLWYFFEPEPNKITVGKKKITWYS